MATNLLSIDPGATFGYAVWGSPRTLLTTDTHKSYTPNWQKNICNACAELHYLLGKYSPPVVACEKPFNAGGGSAYAAAGTGSIIKLTMMVGGLIEVCRSKGCRLVFIEVQDWRGGLKDHHVQQRLKQRWRETGRTEYIDDKAGHEWDAVGIGLYYFTGRKL